MHGKFWIGEQPVSQFGRDIPPPYHNFISIRSSILPQDAALLRGSDGVILNNLLDGSEDMCDILGSVLGYSYDLSASSDDVVNLFLRLKDWSGQFSPSNT